MSTIIEKLNHRYATKKFQTTKIPQEKRELLLESLRLSASSFGLQPWKFIVVESQTVREKLVEAAWGQEQIRDASDLIVLSRPKKLTEQHINEFIRYTANVRNVPLESLDQYKSFVLGFVHKMTEEEKGHWMARQVYLALGTLLTTAAIEGIDACPMEGFDPEKFDQILELDKYNLKSVVLCTLGYRHEEDKYSALAKVRFSSDDVFLYI